jgi:hypothetical protein
MRYGRRRRSRFPVACDEGARSTLAVALCVAAGGCCRLQAERLEAERLEGGGL